MNDTSHWFPRVTLVFRRDRYGGEAATTSRSTSRGVADRPIHRAQRGLHPASTKRFETRDGVALRRRADRVDYPSTVAQVARVNAATLANLALAPARAGRRPRIADHPADQRHRPSPGPPVPEPDVRPATAVCPGARRTDPLWTHALDVGDATEATIEGLSRDDYFFAVQSVDDGGHPSVPSVPGPARRAAPF